MLFKLDLQKLQNKNHIFQLVDVQTKRYTWKTTYPRTVFLNLCMCVRVRCRTGAWLSFLKYHERSMTYFKEILPTNTRCKQCWNLGEGFVGEPSTLVAYPY